MEKFLNRRAGGVLLGKLLMRDYANADAIVFGIPRGGVEVAVEVAKMLEGRLSVIVTKKLLHPKNPSITVGAVAEDGSVFVNGHAQGLSASDVQDLVNENLGEIKRRVQYFRKGKQIPDVCGRVAIIVDDAIATGSTVIPAIKMCRSHKAARVIVAAPVAGRDFLREISTLADQVLIPSTIENFSTISQGFKSVEPTTDKQVADLLEQVARRKHRVLY